MDYATVEQAVMALRAQGRQPSVRAVHRLVGGGSFGDLAPLVKAVLRGEGGSIALAEDVIDPESNEPPTRPPSPGMIETARTAAQAAAARECDLHQRYHQLGARLRAMQMVPGPTLGDATLDEVLRQEQQRREMPAQLEQDLAVVQRLLDQARQATLTAENRLSGLLAREAQIHRELRANAGHLARAEAGLRQAEAEGERLRTAAKEPLDHARGTQERLQTELAALTGGAAP